MSRNFNENSRVKFPALVHLCSMGYRYLSLKSIEYDVNTNILTDVLRCKIKEFNPDKTDIEISQFIAKISNVPDNFTFSVWVVIKNDLTKRYGVSEQALRYRLQQLNLAKFTFTK